MRGSRAAQDVPALLAAHDSGSGDPEEEGDSDSGDADAVVVLLDSA